MKVKTAYFLIFTVLIAFQISGCKKRHVARSVEGTENTDGSGSLETGQTDYKITYAQGFTPQHLILTGYVKGGANGSIIFDELDTGGNINPIISIIINENGLFMLEQEIPQPGIYRLRFPNGEIHLFLRGGNVNVNTDIQDIPSYSVTGSKESVDLKEMYLIFDQINEKLYALEDRRDMLSKDKKRVRELLAFMDSLPLYNERIAFERSEKIKRFITRIDTSMVALLAVNRLNPDLDYAFIAQIRDKFAKICPNSKFFKVVDEKLKKITPTSAGYNAPDITVPDVNGKNISLADFRGNTTLLYFWQSSSAPCRNANAVINGVYQKYKKNGFKIYAVSLDEASAPWKKAIADDNIGGWTHVSNILGWDDEISVIYRVDQLPCLILISGTGQIKARGFKPDKLETNLVQVLSGK